MWICSASSLLCRGPVISRLIVISGPSGCGKGTLIAQLLSRVPGLVVSISATTRPKRIHEQDGREYFFLSRNEFEKWIAEGRFLEWAEYNGELYGTPKDEVERQLAAGRDVVLEIELEGAWQVLERYPDALMIFIAPPSLEELERRLRGRNTEPEEAVCSRLAKASEEMAVLEAEMGSKGRHRFDCVIVNAQVNEAAAELAQVILNAREQYEQADYR